MTTNQDTKYQNIGNTSAFGVLLSILALLVLVPVRKLYRWVKD